MPLTKVTYSMIDGAAVNVLDFGADPTGVSDSTSALAAAEAQAFANGTTLYFPAGTYNQNGALEYRCSIFAYGATIQNTASTAYSSNWGDSTVKFNAQSFLHVKGLTVDGNGKSPGIGLLSCNNITIEDCFVRNCMGLCFNNYSGSFNSYINCVADGVIYKTTGGSGEPADGFYSGESSDTSHINCAARNFERIGFVTDGKVTEKSFRPRYVSCVAEKASNVDRSLTENNAGFWMENTNGVFMDDIVVREIAGNAGQTNGRVRGIVLTEVGDSTENIATLTNFTVGDSTGTLPRGITFGGTIGLANVIVQNGNVINCNIGIEIGGALKSVTIDSVNLYDNVYNFSTQGGIVLYTAAQVSDFSVRNVSEINPTYVANASTLNIELTGNISQQLTISDCDSFSIRSPATITGNVLIANSNIVKRDAVNPLIAQTGSVQVVNCSFSFVAGGNSELFMTQDCGTAAQAVVSNCVFNGTDWLIAGGINTLVSNCIFNDCRVDWDSITENSTIKFNNCEWHNTSLECLRTQFYDLTNDTFIVQNCSFYTGAAIAILKRNYSPTYVVLQGNTYSSTNLTDLTTTSSVNNVLN